MMSSERKPKLKKNKVVTEISGGPKSGSTRVRVFKALSTVEHPDGLSLKEIRKVCGLSGNSGFVRNMVQEEVLRGRIRKWTGYRGESEKETAVYCLSFLGRRDLDACRVDGNAHAGKRIGKSWEETGRG